MTHEIDRPSRPNTYSTLLEILQNAVFAGATAVEATTRADDYGGTEVTVTDDGHGAADLAAFTEPGLSRWPEPPAAEIPGGYALMDGLGGQAFEIATRTGPEDPGRTMRHKPAAPDELTWTESLDALLPRVRGTAIRFRTRATRSRTLTALRNAAAYAPIEKITIDGEPATRSNIAGNTLRRRPGPDGIVISVNKRRKARTHDAQLYAVPITIAIQDVPADESMLWTAHMNLNHRGTAPFRRHRTKRHKLDDRKTVAGLRDAGYTAILETIAEQDEATALATRVVNIARSRGIRLKTAEAPLAPWTPRGGDGRARRTAGAGDIIIDLDGSDDADYNRPTRVALERALGLNRGNQAFEHDRQYEGQAWYDRIPVATGVRFTVRTPAGGSIDANNREAFRRRFVELSPIEIHAELTDRDKRPVKSLKTDLAIVGDEGALSSAWIYVASDHRTTVDELVDTLERAFFRPPDHRNDPRERAEFRAEAEHAAGKLLETPENADLRQIIRAAANHLTPRITRPPHPREDIRITVKADGITAEITNTRTKKTLARTASYTELRKDADG